MTSATCPRCGTIILASPEAKHLVCPTCQARYCPLCKDWKERGQKYCPNCGLRYGSPPPIIHPSIKHSAGWMLLLVFLLAIFSPWLTVWQGALSAMVVMGVYFAVYLLRLWHNTLLTWAVRRELVVLAREGIIWASVAYFWDHRLETNALVVLIIATGVATALGLFIMNWLDPPTVEELRINRPIWKALLGMKAKAAVLMHFPAVQ